MLPISAPFAALDVELDGGARFDERRPPLARAGGDHEFAARHGRKPWPESSWAVSNSGSPTMFE